jgi:uncharacterized protein YehS (DUF1456 family)
MKNNTDNNSMLWKLWQATGLSQQEMLDLLNEGQVRKTALSTLKSYMAKPGVTRRRDCPDEILLHAKKMLAKLVK